MDPRRFLYLSSQRLDLYRPDPGGMQWLASFPAGEAGVAAFRQWLQDDRGARYTFLANLAEESFHNDTIPFLRGHDRRAVITRKLGQLFFGTPYVTALSRGIDKGRRREERLLLAALTQPAVLDPWLAALREQERPVSGLYSAALLGDALTHRLGLKQHERCLVLTVQDDSLRQSYFVGGQLQMSRLAPLSAPAPAGVVQLAALEADKLARYLASQRLWSREDSPALPAILLAPAAARPFIDALATNPEALTRLEFLDIAEAAQRIGLKTPPGEPRADSLLLELLRRHPPAAQFAPSGLRHDHRLWQLRTLLLRASAIVLLACLLLASRGWHESLSLHRETQQLRQESADRQQRYQALLASFPSVAVSTDTLRAVIERYRPLERQAHSSEPLLTAISRALDAIPQVELSALEWSQGPSLSDHTAPPENPTASETNQQSAALRGSLRMPPQATPREAMTVFKALIQRLGSETGGQIVITQAPYDLEPGKALRSSDNEGTAIQPQSFALAIQRPLPRAPVSPREEP